MSVHHFSTHARLCGLARQHPLLETWPSVQALAPTQTTPPRAVIAGVGLASGRYVSRALPLDALALVFAAEHARRLAGAREMVLLVADAHALAHGAPEIEVRARTATYRALLTRVGERCGLRGVRVLSATELHRSASHRQGLELVRERAPKGADPYLTLEVADIAHFERQYGSVLKVGWVLQRSAIGATRDERVFDQAFRRWMKRDLAALYTKAGRALDDARPKVAPYLVEDTSRRLCLRTDEDVEGKLAWARERVSASTWRGVRRHLRGLTRAYSQLVRPLHGSLEQRAQAMLGQLLSERPQPRLAEEPRQLALA